MVVICVLMLTSYARAGAGPRIMQQQWSIARERDWACGSSSVEHRRSTQLWSPESMPRGSHGHAPGQRSVSTCSRLRGVPGLRRVAACCCVYDAFEFTCPSPCKPRVSQDTRPAAGKMMVQSHNIQLSCAEQVAFNQSLDVGVNALLVNNTC